MIIPLEVKRGKIVEAMGCIPCLIGHRLIVVDAVGSHGFGAVVEPLPFGGVLVVECGDGYDKNAVIVVTK